MNHNTQKLHNINKYTIYYKNTNCTAKFHQYNCTLHTDTAGNLETQRWLLELLSGSGVFLPDTRIRRAECDQCLLGPLVQQRHCRQCQQLSRHLGEPIGECKPGFRFIGAAVAAAMQAGPRREELRMVIAIAVGPVQRCLAPEQLTHGRRAALARGARQRVDVVRTVVGGGSAAASQRELLDVPVDLGALAGHVPQVLLAVGEMVLDEQSQCLEHGNSQQCSMNMKSFGVSLRQHQRNAASPPHLQSHLNALSGAGAYGPAGHDLGVLHEYQRLQPSAVVLLAVGDGLQRLVNPHTRILRELSGRYASQERSRNSLTWESVYGSNIAEL